MSGLAGAVGLTPRNLPVPQPAKGELLIRVHCAGVIPTELGWYPTWHQVSGEARQDAVPGHEFAGIIEAVGEDVGSLEIGRRVFGMNDWYANGAMADYCVTPYFAVTDKPAGVSDAEAASVPISALTAWQALFDHAKIQSGDHVLIHGGAGGVGLFAVQLAALHGAKVTATASAKNLDFVKSLGAGQVIDYRATRFDDVVKDMDAVLDTVGGETLERSWRVLRPGGRLVTVASTASGSNDERVKNAFFIVEPNQKQLTRIAELLDEGTLRTMVDAVLPLVKAAEAYNEHAPRRGRGKMVVSISGQN